jgi:hypothetical protein
MGLFKKMFGGKPAPVQPTAVQSQPTTAEPSEAGMHTVPTELVVEPFGKVNYWDLPTGGRRVRAYFLMERPIEGAQTGVAVDASASMRVAFGRMLLGQASQQDVDRYRKLNLVRQAEQDGRAYLFWTQEAVDDLVRRGVYSYSKNIIEPQVRDMTSYLSKFDADGGTTVIYWAAGDGKQIEVMGDLTGAQCATARFTGPTQSDFGNQTHLLPAITYFVERFKDATWGMYVFITDGRIDDLAAVKKYCISLAREIASGKRNDLKFVLIGVGDEIDEGQMEELDNLDSGTDVDLWDHKIAQEMKQLAEIFAEVVSETVVVVPNDGILRDAQGAVVKDYRDTGLPALLWFDLPADSESFTLEVGGQGVRQALK